MNRKILLAAIIIFTAGLCYFIWSARVARKESSDILSKFKDLDSSLKKSNDRISSINVQKIQDNYMIASSATNLILYIDSLVDLTNTNTSDPQNPVSQEQVKKLKLLILDFNAAVMSARNKTDTIYMAHDTDKNWEERFSSIATKSSVYTYLVLLKNKVLQIQGFT